MILDSLLHFQPGRPLQVPKQETTSWLEYAIDFLEDGKRIIKCVEGRIRHYEIKVGGFQPHLSRIANLEERAITQTPSCSCLASTINQSTRAIHADRVKVFILPQDL